jgi:hypothetical protein
MRQSVLRSICTRIWANKANEDDLLQQGHLPDNQLSMGLMGSSYLHDSRLGRYVDTVRIKRTPEDRTGVQWTKVIALEFNWLNEICDNAILASPPAVKAMAAGAEIRPAWANGAKVLVQGLDPKDIKDVDRLRSRHVIVLDEDVEELLRALLVLPPRVRPKLNYNRTTLSSRTLDVARDDASDHERLISVPGQRKIEWGWFRFKEDISRWAADDPRLCRKCPEKNQIILGFANCH